MLRKQDAVDQALKAQFAGRLLGAVSATAKISVLVLFLYIVALDSNMAEAAVCRLGRRREALQRSMDEFNHGAPHLLPHLHCSRPCCDSRDLYDQLATRPGNWLDRRLGHTSRYVANVNDACSIFYRHVGCGRRNPLLESA